MHNGKSAPESVEEVMMLRRKDVQGPRCHGSWFICCPHAGTRPNRGHKSPGLPVGQKGLGVGSYGGPFHPRHSARSDAESGKRQISDAIPSSFVRSVIIMGKLCLG